MRTGQNKPWRGRHPSGQNKQLEGRRNSGHTSGDLVAAEAYQQYAEHYYRLVAAEQERSRA